MVSGAVMRDTQGRRDEYGGLDVSCHTSRVSFVFVRRQFEMTAGTS